ncbi:hypothetical protein [Streptomyces sp. NPDC101776]|uniref:hypothetical protein n=1 Tax=Streptomyces sp. NPDC101776 TaxID=3366146 RepID=UPI00381B01FA
MQRILATAAAVRHNDHTGQPVLRSLTDHEHRPLGIDHPGRASPARADRREDAEPVLDRLGRVQSRLVWSPARSAGTALGHAAVLIGRLTPREAHDVLHSHLAGLGAP